MAGLGGGGSPLYPPNSAAFKYGNDGRLVVLKLGGGHVPLPAVVTDAPFHEPPARRGLRETLEEGEVLFARYCERCHGFGRGRISDLRRSTTATHNIFGDIVLNGAYVPRGMGRFDDVLTWQDLEAIQAYVIDQAWSAYALEPR